MQSKPYYYAFKVDYTQVVKDLKTKVHIAEAQMLEQNPQKQIVCLEAVWYTGATCSVISEKVVEALRLTPFDKTENITAAGCQTVDVYYIDLMLPNNVTIPNLKVICCPLGDVDALIGMDIISMGDFAISNGGGKTHFSYCIPPHKNPVCLYEKSLKVNPKV